jgi:hypothetical protein
MKFTHTLAAARSNEQTTWAVADALVQDFKEAAVTPTTLHFKEAAEELEGLGHTYTPKVLAEYWRTASIFGSSRRKRNVPLAVYEEIVNRLWGRLDAETRSNNLVAYASQFFSEHPNAPASSRRAGADAWSLRAARTWATNQAAALDAERRAREEAKEKARLKRRLKQVEAELAEAIEADDMERAREVLVEVNEVRGRLGMELLKLVEPEEDEEEEKASTETDEEATEEEQQKKAEEQQRLEARTAIEAAIAKVGIRIASLGHTFLRVQEHLTVEDRDAYAEEIGLEEGRLALIKARVGGTTTDAELTAALAQWEAEATS